MAIYFELVVVKCKLLTPSEFWKSTPGEVTLLLDDQIEQAEDLNKKKGGLTDEMRERLDKRRAKERAKGVKIL